MKLDKMTMHYLVTGLWSTTDYNDTHLDANYCITDISEEFQEKALKECSEMYSLIGHLITEDELDLETIGHDFWLTRNHHGAGFWDGDYVNGDEITKIVQKHFSENDDELREAIEQLNKESA